MSSSIVISGFTSAFKVPGIYMETVFGAGEISNASAPLKCLVIGLKGSTGTITNDGTLTGVIALDDTTLNASGRAATFNTAAV